DCHRGSGGYVLIPAKGLRSASGQQTRQWIDRLVEYRERRWVRVTGVINIFYSSQRDTQQTTLRILAGVIGINAVVNKVTSSRINNINMYINKIGTSGTFRFESVRVDSRCDEWTGQCTTERCSVQCYPTRNRSRRIIRIEGGRWR